MYIKEWSVFAIRNLCEENEENQGVIEQLRMQGVANNDELDKLGIKIDVAEGGALKFSTTKKQQDADGDDFIPIIC
ncbi:hypothetical protein PPL_04861 [Heterostelium album PN500]|uniref:Ataxin-10 domain-containing protein n=1 Tax=Heterostelium pallidum (strain ATCC 26659 / Pp 5 / PN500) TaxID=670386 RepID=D3B8R8_HETP5|nr:hypothetical protein PPL_04861 [Heterostelium album PN500]EFA82436.1 hypothetical protein PPL_04861 [Heterostelium album PN500]|eukprot:XP_020434553.1 hypothetical protein PPL_04861 [Heterostelium album PN500]